MKKSSIMSLLLVFSVLVSCAFHLSVCAEETAPPDTASVSTTEEAPAQPAAEPVSNPAPIHIQEPASNPGPEPTAAPTSSAQSAANPAPESVAVPIEPEQPVTNPAPEPVPSPAANPSAETSVSPAANPSPESVAESAAVSSTDPDTVSTAVSSTDQITEPIDESTAAPAAKPAPEPDTETKDAENNAEPVSSDQGSPVRSDGDTLGAVGSPTSGAPASGDTVRKDTESMESNIRSTDNDGNTSQNDIHAAETDEPATGSDMDAAETALHTAEDSTETYSITLRNRVYGYTGSPISLSAEFLLSIQRSFLGNTLDLDRFKALFPVEGALYDYDDDSYFVMISLENNETRSLPGIPSHYSVNVDSISAEYEYTDEVGEDQEFATSYIVGTNLDTHTRQTLTKDMSSTGDVEYTFMRFPSQDGTKLFVINDSVINGDDPLELNLTVNADEDASYIFEYLSDEYGRKGDTITLNSSNQYTIRLKPGEYGYITPDFGAATANLSKINALSTPSGVNITTALSTVGEYNGSIPEMSFTGLANVSGTNPAIFSLFRAEKPKTDLGTPKTDDDDPGTDPGSDPGNPGPGDDPGTPNPGPTPGNDPGTPDPGNNTENKTSVSTHTTSSPRKDKTSPNTDQPSTGTSVSQKTPAVGTTSMETEAVDTADRTPIAMYVLLMLAALAVAAAIMSSVSRSRRLFRH